MDTRIKLLATIETFLGASLIADGTSRIVNYISKADGIRNAVYQAATKITPEVIEQANDLTSKIGFEGVSGAMEAAAGVAFLAMSYWMFKEEEIKELKK